VSAAVLASSVLASGDDGTGFGTFAGTILIVALIAASVVIFRMLNGSLKRMNRNVSEHPENFGIDANDEAAKKSE
jgi:hypothetical protein